MELHTLAESCALAVAGTAAGWVLGGGVAAIVASRAGSPAGAVIEHALLSASGLLTAAAVAAAAGLLLYLTVRAPAVHLGRVGFTPLDAAACGAVAVVLVGWARGSVDAQQLAGGNGASAFLLLVPALIVFAVAVLSARLLAPTLRALGRAGRRGPISLRLAAASLARNPGHAAIVATFLVASLGLALFAVAYRSTLLQGQRDEAAFAVPASYILTEDLSQLVPVLHGAPAASLPEQPTPVVRLSGNVPSGTTFSFLALPGGRCRRCRDGDPTSRTSRSPRSAGSSRLEPPGCGCSHFRRAAGSRCPWPRPVTTWGFARSSARASATTSRSRSATRGRTSAWSCTGASRSGTRRWRNWSSTS